MQENSIILQIKSQIVTTKNRLSKYQGYIMVGADMKKIQKLFSLTLFLSGFFGILLTAPVQADCGGAETAIINCSQSGNGKNVEDNGVWGILIIGLNILTAGVGIVGIGGIVYGAILYASAGDKSGQIEQARNVITNVIIGLVAFALMWAFLQFLIPGGIFS